MTAEVVHNYNIDDEDTEIAKDFAYLGSGTDSETSARKSREG